MKRLLKKEGTLECREEKRGLDHIFSFQFQFQGPLNSLSTN